MIRTTDDVEAAVPRGKKENVMFVYDNTENIKRREMWKKSDFTDDCGIWNSNVGSTKTLYFTYTGEHT